MINAECIKLSRHVFTTLIIAQRAQSLTSDILSPCFELLESSKRFGLVLQQINSFKARSVINEGDPKAIPLVSSNLNRAMDVAVDQLEWSGGS
jgi:hypothetical protein